MGCRLLVTRRENGNRRNASMELALSQHHAFDDLTHSAAHAGVIGRHAVAPGSPAG
jgi:hypothetical protein